MALQKKSNVIRLLEARRITYQALTYSTEIHSAEDVAQIWGFQHMRCIRHSSFCRRAADHYWW
jgi:hypothetical protein